MQKEQSIRELTFEEIDFVSGAVGPQGALFGASLGAMSGGALYMLSHMRDNNASVAGFAISVTGGALAGGTAGFTGNYAILANTAIAAATAVAAMYADRAAAEDRAAPHHGSATDERRGYDGSVLGHISFGDIAYSYTSHPSAQGFVHSWNGIVFGAGVQGEVRHSPLSRFAHM